MLTFKIWSRFNELYRTILNQVQHW